MLICQLLLNSCDVALPPRFLLSLFTPHAANDVLSEILIEEFIALAHMTAYLQRLQCLQRIGPIITTYDLSTLTLISTSTLTSTPISYYLAFSYLTPSVQSHL